MIVCISNLLTPDEIAHITTDLGQAKYIDTIICCNGLRLRSALAYLISLGMAG
jgi:hypothetical protein